jgi:ornithine cyclodeaminase
LQLKALCLVRPVKQAVIWARDAAKAQKAAAELQDELGITVQASGDAEAAVSSADVVITTTPSATPVLKAEWLRPGQHVTAMGSDQEHKNELDPECLVRADPYVPDRLSQTRILGELRTAIGAGLVSDDRQFAELGAIVAGKAPGRSSDTAITVADLTGTGVQDTAIANFARSQAIKSGTGTDFSN